jgi:hypothetical protein
MDLGHGFVPFILGYNTLGYRSCQIGPQREARGRGFEARATMGHLEEMNAVQGDQASLGVGMKPR